MIRSTNNSHINVTTGIADLAQSVVKTCAAANPDMQRLAHNFQPGPKDVICKRGKTAYNHNKHFRELIKENLERYSDAGSKLEKSLVVSDIVDAISEGSPNGGFVRCINGVWWTVSDSVAREKVGGSFRDMLHDQYKSSTKAKKRRREEQGTNEEDREPALVVPETTTSASKPANKHRRVEHVPAPVSPKSSELVCAFGDLLKEISSRKQELEKVPALPKLDTKKPTLPPPYSLPSAPTTINVMRGCSVESTLSFDIDDMKDLDQFQIGLARFRSVSSSVSFLSFEMGAS